MEMNSIRYLNMSLSRTVYFYSATQLVIVIVLMLGTHQIYKIHSESSKKQDLKTTF